MLLLATIAHPQIESHRLDAHGHHLGRLVQPRATTRMDATWTAGYPWAADNDCFQGLDPHAFCAMLDRLPVPDTPAPWRDTSCLFVTVPDVVGDARQTARLFDQWAPAVERRGLPVALVLQDGVEHLDAWLDRAWHRLDAVFIGGTTEFKLGPVAAAIAARANAAGKWVHMGRVNTRRRVEYAESIGCDSFDGTAFCRWRNTRMPDGVRWAAEAGRQLTLTPTTVPELPLAA